MGSLTQSRDQAGDRCHKLLVMVRLHIPPEGAFSKGHLLNIKGLLAIRPGLVFAPLEVRFVI